MKKLCLILAFLPSICSAQQVYYCVDEVMGGIKWESKKAVPFNEDRYKVAIDWAAGRITSKEFYLDGRAHCWSYEFYDGTRYLTCISPMGVGLSIDKDSKKFSGFQFTHGQDLAVSYGSCEAF